jgi:hypothetical protein
MYSSMVPGGGDMLFPLPMVAQTEWKCHNEPWVFIAIKRPWSARGLYSQALLGGHSQAIGRTVDTERTIPTTKLAIRGLDCTRW